MRWHTIYTVTRIYNGFVEVTLTFKMKGYKIGVRKFIALNLPPPKNPYFGRGETQNYFKEYFKLPQQDVSKRI